MPRLMGLDFGDKTIGVAVSDPGQRVALGLETLRRPQAEALRPNIRRLEALIRQYDVSHIVLGMPKRTDNTLGERSEKTRAFKAKLERNFKKIPVILWDERFSTAGVLQTGVSRETARRAVDEMAAVYILQGYLDYLGTTAALSAEPSEISPDKEGHTQHLQESEGHTLNEFDAFEDMDGMDSEDSAITMFDEEGNEIQYEILASRESDGVMYLLLVETFDEEAAAEEGEDTAEVLQFKCVANEDEDMVLELVDEGHEEFEKVFALFKEDYDALGIIVDE